MQLEQFPFIHGSSFLYAASSLRREPQEAQRLPLLQPYTLYCSVTTGKETCSSLSRACLAEWISLALIVLTWLLGSILKRSLSFEECFM